MCSKEIEKGGQWIEKSVWRGKKKDLKGNEIGYEYTRSSLWKSEIFSRKVWKIEISKQRNGIEKNRQEQKKECPSTLRKGTLCRIYIYCVMKKSKLFYLPLIIIRSILKRLSALNACG